MESEADINPFDMREQNSSQSNNGDDENGNESSDRKIKFNPDDMFYDMSGDKHLVIFNHDKYDQLSRYYYNSPPSRRNYSDKDVVTLNATFSKIGFRIDVYHNKDYASVWEIFCQLRKTDYSEASCLCIVFLTHGSRDGELCAYDRPHKLQDVIKLFERHPTLAGKPKLFFIQACRGDKMDDGNVIATDGEEKGNFFITPSHADFLIMRSTVEEYLSYRDVRGSWLIQELCAAIDQYHHQLDILHIITLVQRKIAYDYATYTRSEKTTEKRQMPETTFTLTKFLKFT